MAQLNLRVGASVDRNMQVAFQPLVEGAKRAKAAIEAEGQKAGRAIGTNVRKGAKDAEAAFAALEAEMKGVPKAMNAGSAAVTKFGKDAKKSFDETKRAFSDMAKDAERSMAKIAAAQRNGTSGNMPATTAGKLRALVSTGARSVASSAYEAAGGAPKLSNIIGGVASMGAGLAKKAASAAIGIAKDLAKSAGVDTDVSTIAKKNFDLESQAQTLSNASIVANDPNNQMRVSKQTLMNQALDVAEKYGGDANDALDGLAKFVSKTGDLKTGRDIMAQMAMYAKATGASASDMMDASGDLANQLGDGVNKAETLSTLMKVFAGQGRLGAIEIKHLSTQMAKIGAASSRFEGGTTAIAQMGAAAQLARGTGGSPSAASAATAVSAFGDMFSKKARLAAFEKYGVDTQGAGGKVRDPKAILLDAMVAAQKNALAHGDKTGLGKEFDKAMGTMISSSKARQVSLGMESKFKEAGGGEAGVKAATDAIDKFQKAIISDEEITASFNAAMKTSTSQAEVFNASIRKSAMQMQTDLMPAMAALAKELIPLAKKAAGVVQWLTGGSKEGETMTADATANVDETIKTMGKQMEGGKISDVTIERGKEEARQAKFAVERAKAELETSKETLDEKTGKKEDKTFSSGQSWLSSGWNIPGRMYGSLYDMATDQEGKAKEDVAQKEKTLKEAQAAYDKMVAANEDVKRKLDGKLVVVIDNIEQLKSAVAPAPGADGRQPPPEAKPR